MSNLLKLGLSALVITAANCDNAIANVLTRTIDLYISGEITQSSTFEYYFDGTSNVQNCPRRCGGFDLHYYQEAFSDPNGNNFSSFYSEFTGIVDLNSFSFDDSSNKISRSGGSIFAFSPGDVNTILYTKYGNQGNTGGLQVSYEVFYPISALGYFEYFRVNSYRYIEKTYDYNTNELISTISVVPEKSTWSMLLLGFAAIGFASYRSLGKSSSAAA